MEAIDGVRVVLLKKVVNERGHLHGGAARRRRPLHRVRAGVCHLHAAWRDQGLVPAPRADRSDCAGPRTARRWCCSTIGRTRRPLAGPRSARSATSCPTLVQIPAGRLAWLSGARSRAALLLHLNSMRPGRQPIRTRIAFRRTARHPVRLAMILSLITDDVALAAEAERAGIDRIMIDLEREGKAQRQAGRKPVPVQPSPGIDRPRQGRARARRRSWCASTRCPARTPQEIDAVHRRRGRCDHAAVFLHGRRGPVVREPGRRSQPGEPAGGNVVCDPSTPRLPRRRPHRRGAHRPERSQHRARVRRHPRAALHRR